MIPAVFPDAYRAMLAEDRHHHPEAFAYTTSQFFRGLRLSGARALEIGSGAGLQAIFMALNGAQVTSLEPEGIGATSGVIAKQRDRCRRLGLANVEVRDADFNQWETSERFDLILSKASINHLYATEHHALRHAETYKGYLEVLRRVHGLLAPGGVFVATDACRYGFFRLTRKWIRRPWRTERTSVNWRHHQNPATWKRLLEEAGFSRVRVDYPVPYRLRHLAPLVNNAAANFWLQGSFIIRATR
jgi:SAM-dependent methyltransferase